MRPLAALLCGGGLGLLGQTSLLAETEKNFSITDFRLLDDHQVKLRWLADTLRWYVVQRSLRSALRRSTRVQPFRLMRVGGEGLHRWAAGPGLLRDHQKRHCTQPRLSPGAGFEGAGTQCPRPTCACPFLALKEQPGTAQGSALGKGPHIRHNPEGVACVGRARSPLRAGGIALRRGAREAENLGQDASSQAAGKRGRHAVPPPYLRREKRSRAAQPAHPNAGLPASAEDL